MHRKKVWVLRACSVLITCCSHRRSTIEGGHVLKPSHHACMDNTPHQRPAFLSIADVAHTTGLSQRTIRRHIQSGALWARRAGGRVLIRDTDLAAWFESLEPARGVA